MTTKTQTPRLLRRGNDDAGLFTWATTTRESLKDAKVPKNTLNYQPFLDHLLDNIDELSGGGQTAFSTARERIEEASIQHSRKTHPLVYENSDTIYLEVVDLVKVRGPGSSVKECYLERIKRVHTFTERQLLGVDISDPPAESASADQKALFHAATILDLCNTRDRLRKDNEMSGTREALSRIQPYLDPALVAEYAPKVAALINTRLATNDYTKMVAELLYSCTQGDSESARAARQQGYMNLLSATEMTAKSLRVAVETVRRIDPEMRDFAIKAAANNLRNGTCEQPSVMFAVQTACAMVDNGNVNGSLQQWLENLCAKVGELEPITSSSATQALGNPKQQQSKRVDRGAKSGKKKKEFTKRPTEGLEFDKDGKTICSHCKKKAGPNGAGVWHTALNCRGEPPKQSAARASTNLALDIGRVRPKI